MAIYGRLVDIAKARPPSKITHALAAALGLEKDKPANTDSAFPVLDQPNLLLHWYNLVTEVSINDGGTTYTVKSRSTRGAHPLSWSSLDKDEALKFVVGEEICVAIFKKRA